MLEGEGEEKREGKREREPKIIIVCLEGRAENVEREMGKIWEGKR